MNLRCILLTSFCLSFSIILSGQDIIIRRVGTEIKSKVTEISDLVIKYKLYDNLLGPNYVINKNEVLLIIYENGKREYFTVEKLESEIASFESNNRSQFSEKHKSITISTGLSGIFGAFAFKSTIENEYYYSSKSFFVGPLSISKNVGITPQFAFHYGLSTSYYKFTVVDYFSNLDFDALIPSLDLGGSFHFQSKKRIDPYLKVVAGLAYWASLSGDYRFNAITPNYGLKFGGNFYGKNKSGLNLEVGYELFSYIKIGYTFGKNK